MFSELDEVAMGGVVLLMATVGTGKTPGSTLGRLTPTPMLRSGVLVIDAIDVKVEPGDCKLGVWEGLEPAPKRLGSPRSTPTSSRGWLLVAIVPEDKESVTGVILIEAVDEVCPNKLPRSMRGWFVPTSLEVGVVDAWTTGELDVLEAAPLPKPSTPSTPLTSPELSGIILTPELACSIGVPEELGTGVAVLDAAPLPSPRIPRTFSISPELVGNVPLSKLACIIGEIAVGVGSVVTGGGDKLEV
jgi:hypothetical protein